MHRHARRTFATTGTMALLAATLLTAPGAYAAAATSCQGKTVTIDGSAGAGVVTGTPGDDVIAAVQGSAVTALAGNDTICVLPGTATNATTVDAGAGNDSVDTSTLPTGTTVIATLGADDDSYTGGAAADQVTSGTGGGHRLHGCRQRQPQQRRGRPAERRQDRPWRRRRRPRLARHPDRQRLRGLRGRRQHPQRRGRRRGRHRRQRPARESGRGQRADVAGSRQPLRGRVERDLHRLHRHDRGRVLRRPRPRDGSAADEGQGRHGRRGRHDDAPRQCPRRLHLERWRRQGRLPGRPRLRTGAAGPPEHAVRDRGTGRHAWTSASATSRTPMSSPRRCSSRVATVRTSSTCRAAT